MFWGGFINIQFLKTQYKSVFFFFFSTGIVEIVSGPSLSQPTVLTVQNTEIYRHP